MIGCVLPLVAAVGGLYDFLIRWGRVMAIGAGVLMAARYVRWPR